MAGSGGLPAGFDPEEHSRGRLVEERKADSFEDGLTLLHEDRDAGVYVMSVRKAATIRCWHCYRRPDGSYDCFEIPCPWGSTRPVAAQ